MTQSSTSIGLNESTSDADMDDCQTRDKSPFEILWNRMRVKDSVERISELELSHWRDGIQD